MEQYCYLMNVPECNKERFIAYNLLDWYESKLRFAERFLAKEKELKNCNDGVVEDKTILSALNNDVRKDNEVINPFLKRARERVKNIRILFDDFDGWVAVERDDDYHDDCVFSSSQWFACDEDIEEENPFTEEDAIKLDEDTTSYQGTDSDYYDDEGLDKEDKAAIRREIKKEVRCIYEQEYGNYLISLRRKLIEPYSYYGLYYKLFDIDLFTERKKDLKALEDAYNQGDRAELEDETLEEYISKILQKRTDKINSILQEKNRDIIARNSEVHRLLDVFGNK